MQTRTQYHPLIIFKHQQGILEDFHYQQIPSSTLRNWTNRNPTLVYGFNTDKADDLNELVRQFLIQKKLHATFRALLAVNHCLITALDKHKGRYDNNTLRQQFIQVINRYAAAVPRRKLLRWSGITSQQFYAWQRRVCKASILELCRPRHISQLTFKEVKTIGNYLSTFLPLLHTKSAVYSKMIRKGAAYMSIRTFYSYSRRMGFNKRKKVKAKRKVGLVADRPKQILHMDVTVYKFADNTKAYIYLVQDNYSRLILNWKISRVCNSTIALANLKEACQKHKLFDQQGIDIIVDGGSENKGMLSQFVKEKTSFQLKIAGKDIIQSNSMIESANMQLKHYFLFPRDIKDFDALLKEMPKIMHENGYERVRHYLGFRTPAEAFDEVDIGFDQIAMSIKNASKSRLQNNRSHPCKQTCY